MDELVKQVSQRTGISEDKAQEAVNTVIGFLKARLPEPLAGQLDGLLNSAGGTIASAGDAIADKAGDILGGVLGGKKD
ncbi:MAG: hypothetical protein WCB68_13455 [Pyrinomonadaceae bacterium]